MSITASNKKKIGIFAWVVLIVGLILAIDGLFHLMAGNSSRAGEALLGGILAIVSSGFFLLSYQGKKLNADESAKQVEPAK